MSFNLNGGLEYYKPHTLVRQASFFPMNVWDSLLLKFQSDAVFDHYDSWIIYIASKLYPAELLIWFVGVA